MPNRMIARLIPCLFTSLLLAGCAAQSGYGECAGGPCTARATTSPYNQADRFVDSQGYPLPGWAQMKYGTEGGGNR